MPQCISSETCSGRNDGWLSALVRSPCRLRIDVARLEAEANQIDAERKVLVKQTAPDLAARTPQATFAHPCGASPIDASSGKHKRHRLNHGWRPPSQLRPLEDRPHPRSLRGPAPTSNDA